MRPERGRKWSLTCLGRRGSVHVKRQYWGFLRSWGTREREEGVSLSLAGLAISWHLSSMRYLIGFDNSLKIGLLVP